MKHAFKLFCKAFGFVILCIAFLFLWNSLRISKAIEDGAFEKAVFCIDEHHIRPMRSDTPAIRFIDFVIHRQLLHELRLQRPTMTQWHIYGAFNYLTVTIFWSEAEKRALYDLVIDDAQNCSSFK